MKLTSYISFGAIALGLLALVGCAKQDLIIPESNDPIFSIRGTLGNEHFDLAAGADNSYMYTSTKLHNGVRVFTGELSNGHTSVELGVFDGNLDKPNSVPQADLQNVTMQLARRYFDPLAVLNPQSIDPNQSTTNVDWYINGTFAGSGQISIYEPGRYNICAHVTFVTGQTEQICDEVILGYTRNANCSIDLDLSQVGISGMFIADLNTTGDSIESVEWTLNDSVISTNPYVQHPLANGSNHLKARVRFQNGVVREKTCFIDGNAPSQWISDFSIFELSSTTSITPQDYQVRLIIQNNGKVYESVQAENEGSSITLLSLEPFEANANGNNVYKATLQIEAIVMEMSTEKLIPVSFVATMGVEVPE